jgi:outer membrane lipoprotein SlyB
MAKKGIGKAGAAAVGATVGTAVAPGLGTAVGALIGAGVGLVVGVGIDMAALAAEEKLTRDDMRRDLLSAVSESLQSYRETFECKAATPALK